MQLSVFKQYVKDVVNVGDVIDTFLLVSIEQALLWLERTNNFKYMELYEDSDTLGIGDKSFTMPSLTKALHFVRIPKSSGAYQYIEQEDPRNFESPDDAIPTHFYWSGERTLRFNNTADEVYTLEFHRIAITPFDSSDNFEPFLLKVAHDLVLAQTLLHLAVPMKDPDLFASNRPFRDEALHTMVVLDQEMRRSAESPEMLFG